MHTRLVPSPVRLIIMNSQEQLIKFRFLYVDISTTTSNCHSTAAAEDIALQGKGVLDLSRSQCILNVSPFECLSFKDWQIWAQDRRAKSLNEFVK